MQKTVIVLLLLVAGIAGHAQELYVFTEPASNMPAKSISARLSEKLLRINMHPAEPIKQRLTPEIMLGLNKKWMVHVAGTFSDMYSSGLRWESIRLYAKYRFLSIDDVHQHFRMAAFGEVTHSENPATYQEISLDGDQSGFLGGVVITQLWNKLALSSTLGYAQVTTKKPDYLKDSYPWQAFNYTASAGYLLLPRSYTSYKQTNVNLYVELLGQKALDRSLYTVDLAPALQLIFNSNAKLNLGYRFQLNSNMYRMAEKSWLVSFEYVFLDALPKRKSRS